MLASLHRCRHFLENVNKDGAFPEGPRRRKEAPKRANRQHT